jgi:hypothetical protein
MNDNEVMELGGYCETLLSSPSFQHIAMRFEQELVDEILVNKPDDQTQRDRISRVQGFREFLAYIGRAVQRRSEIVTASDTPPDHSDDPSVHDIFDFEYIPETGSND